MSQGKVMLAVRLSIKEQWRQCYIFKKLLSRIGHKHFKVLELCIIYVDILILHKFQTSKNIQGELRVIHISFFSMLSWTKILPRYPLISRLFA